MNISSSRGGAALAGALGVWLIATAGASVSAQSAARPPAGVSVLEVAPHVHLISGDGGNITVQSGADGIVLVDSGAGQHSAAVLEAIKQISPQPIRFIINTSAHPDFVG